MEDNSEGNNEIDEITGTEEEVVEKKGVLRAEKVFKEIAEWAICLFIAFFIAVSIKYFLGTFTTVKQLSMDPTLQQNDKLWLDRTVRTFKKDYEVGEIATFEAPDFSTIEQINNKNPKAIYTERTDFKERFVKDFLEISKISYIKRVIAKEGDHVKIEGGMIVVNGEAIVEDYLEQGTYTKASNLTDFIVPENTLFLVGDNRKNSTDSRSFGCIPLEKMEGKIVGRVLPLKAMGKIPSSYFEIIKLNDK